MTLLTFLTCPCSLGFDETKQKQLEAANFALFTSLWWPDAGLEKLKILTYLIIWLFTWDGEIDEPTGTFSSGFDGAQGYRNNTLQFVRSCPGLVIPVDHVFVPLLESSKVSTSFALPYVPLRIWSNANVSITWLRTLWRLPKLSKWSD